MTPLERALSIHGHTSSGSLESSRAYKIICLFATPSFFATQPLGEQYRRLARRIGKNKALIAIAHSILVIIYHLLNEEKTYQELGSTYFQEREHDAIKRRALRNLERLGYDVTLQDKKGVA